MTSTGQQAKQVSNWSIGKKGFEQDRRTGKVFFQHGDEGRHLGILLRLRSDDEVRAPSPRLDDLERI